MECLEVLREIELTFGAGRIACLIGPSGCGNSTLLRLLGGLERPTDGHLPRRGGPPATSLNPFTYLRDVAVRQSPLREEARAAHEELADV